MASPIGGAFRLVALALACCASLEAQEEPGPFVHRSWHIDDGLPQSSIYAVEQTRDGYLWIGTLQGLVRFDGTRFTPFSAAANGGLESDRIVGLTEAADGALWVATQSHGLSRYANGVFESYTIEDGLPSNAAGPVGSIVATQAGDLFVGMDRGLVRFVPGLPGGRGHFEPFPGSRQLLGEPVTAILQDPDGSMWVATARGLLRRRTGTSEWEEYSEGIPVGRVGSVLRGRDGTLWIGATQGIGRYDAARDAFDTYPVDGDVVFSLIEDREGTVWAAAPGAGLLRFDGTGFVRQVAGAEEIGAAAVLVFEDREGHLWVGTNGNGLHRLKRSVFSAYAAAAPGAAGPMTHGTIESRNGDIWAGSYASGLIRIRPTEEVTYYGAADGLPSPTTWSIAETADGTLWIGTEAGMVRFDNRADRFIPVSVPGAPALETRRTSAMSLRTDGRLLVGTFLTHLAALTPEEAGPLDAELVLAPEVVPGGGGILAILVGSDGALWAGTQTAGVLRLPPNGDGRFETFEGLGAAAVRTLVEREDGTIWAGTYGSGLCAVSPGQTRFRCLTTEEGLPDNTVHAAIDDESGFVWLSSNAGLFRIRADDLRAYFSAEAPGVRADVFTRADGLPHTEFNGGFQPTVWKTRDGRLLFPTANGVAVVHPDRIDSERSTPPIMRVETIEADGSVLDARNGIEVAAGTNRVVVRYTGIHFGNPDALRFSYRLDGNDPADTWVEGGGDREAVYTNLRPGSYTFEVRGALGSGDWETASVTFRLAPLVYQTLWFQILVALGLASLVGFGATAISRQRFRQELARAEARQALEAERSRISRDMHDEVGASLTEITMLSEIARRELGSAAADPRLERIATTSRGLVESLGQIVWAINPKHDRLPALSGYLREYAANYLEAMGVRRHLDFPRDPANLSVSAETRRNVFVILKEALHNVAKHSGAEEVSVSLHISPDRLELTVEDDGIGFDFPDRAAADQAMTPHSFGTGNGLGNMRRRARDIGGELRIETAEGGGTVVRLVAPLRQLGAPGHG